MLSDFVAKYSLSYSLTPASFFEFWLVDIRAFANPGDQWVITLLENVCQLNKKRDRKLGINLLHRQPHKQ